MGWPSGYPRASHRHISGEALFVVRRGDTDAFAPHDTADPALGRALRRAAEEGVVVYAYGCQVNRREVRIHRPLRVKMGPR